MIYTIKQTWTEGIATAVDNFFNKNILFLSFPDLEALTHTKLCSERGDRLPKNADSVPEKCREGSGEWTGTWTFSAAKKNNAPPCLTEGSLSIV